MYEVKLVAETGAHALPPTGSTCIVCVDIVSSAEAFTGNVVSKTTKEVRARTKRSS